MASKTKKKKPPQKPKPVPTLKLSDEEFIIVHRKASALSHWWRTLQIFSFFLIFITGVTVCICIGRMSNAFGDTCILYGNIYFLYGTNLSDIQPIDLSGDLTNHIGLSRPCNFYQFSPMAGACFAGLLAAIFMQCGGGYEENFLTLRSARIDSSWMLVLPVIPVALVFFVMSIVTLVGVVNGLSAFCVNVIERSHRSLNIESCSQVYSLSYPYRPAYAPPEYQPDTDLYINFLLSQIGASFHFIGWFLALSILIIRCATHADFNVGVLPKKNNYFKSKRPMKSHGSYTLIPGIGDSNDEEISEASSGSGSGTENDTSSSEVDDVFFESQEYPRRTSKTTRSTGSTRSQRKEKMKMKTLHN